MKFVDEYRDPAAARALLKRITHDAEKLDHPIKIMEICGGHTHTIYRYGIENLLPDSIDLVHGPGCPVCVIPMGRVDDALWLAEQPNVILATFGDMMRVPGSNESLLQARARGCDIRFVYSPLDALKIAEDNPDKHVVYFAVGFETTAPSTAVTLFTAKKRALKNFSVFSNHVTIEPPLRAIADGGDTEVDAFIGPGHVATVVGTKAFNFLAEEFNLPVAVAGFEPLDILQSVAMLLEQFVSGAIERGEARVDNQYSRVVGEEGNPTSLALFDEVFTIPRHLRMARPRLARQLRLRNLRSVRRLRRRAPLHPPLQARGRPCRLRMRFRTYRAHQTLGVQGLRHRVYAGYPDRYLHGLPRRCLRRILQLRPHR